MLLYLALVVVAYLFACGTAREWKRSTLPKLYEFDGGLGPTWTAVVLLTAVCGPGGVIGVMVANHPRHWRLGWSLR